LTEKIGTENTTEFVRKILFALVVYYATTLAVPLLHGSYRYKEFFEHFAFVLVMPLMMIGLLVALRTIWTRVRSIPERSSVGPANT
jgi:hypothetical protein